MADRTVSSTPVEAMRQDLLELPFDQYQRYRDVREIADRLRSDGKPLRLLDVGGGEAGYLPALDFFPGDQVWVADLHVFSSPRYVRCSGTNLPFGDRAFDISFSCDTLEHVPREKREKFLRELFRVARRFVILVAPFHNSWNDMAEKVVQEVYTQESGEPNKALREHEEYGLPARDEVEKLFGELSADFLAFQSGNVHNWLLMNSIICTLGPISGHLYRAANRLYNLHFYEADRDPPAYRTGFVACKTAPDKLHMKRLTKALPTWFGASSLGPKTTPETLRALCAEPVFSRWRESIYCFKRILSEGQKGEATQLEFNACVTDLRQQVAHRETLLQDLRQQVAHRDTLLQEAQSQVAHRDNLLQDLQQQVAHRDALLQEAQGQVAHRDTLLQDLKQQVAHRDNLLQDAQQQVMHRDNLLAQSSEQIADRDNQLAEVAEQLRRRELELAESRRTVEDLEGSFIVWWQRRTQRKKKRQP